MNQMNQKTVLMQSPESWESSNDVRESTEAPPRGNNLRDEKDLVRRAQAGCTQSFEELIRRDYKIMLHWCAQAIGRIDEAEDVLQEALSDAFMSLSAFRGESRLNTWICGIAKFKVRKFLQERNRRESVVSLFSEQEIDIDEIPDSTESTEDLMMTRQRKHFALVEMVESLPEKYATQVKLTLQGLKRREIATVLNVPLGTIKSRHCRAVTMLRRKVGNGNRNPAT